MSTDALGNFSVSTALSKASAVTFEISMDLRSGPGLRLSDTEKGAML